MKKKINAKIIMKGVSIENKPPYGMYFDYGKTVYKYVENTPWHEIYKTDKLKNVYDALEWFMVDDNPNDEDEVWYMEDMKASCGYKGVRIRGLYYFMRGIECVPAIKNLYKAQRGIGLCRDPANMILYTVIRSNGTAIARGDMFPTSPYKKRAYSNAPGMMKFFSWVYEGLTPDEIRDIKNDYGITLPPDKYNWNEKIIGLPRSWKYQSKRKNQYRKNMPSARNFWRKTYENEEKEIEKKIAEEDGGLY